MVMFKHGVFIVVLISHLQHGVVKAQLKLVHNIYGMILRPICVNKRIKRVRDKFSHMVIQLVFTFSAIITKKNWMH